MAGEDDPLYTIEEVAAKLRISKDSVRRLFANEDGVLVLTPSKSGSKTGRSKPIVRIPRSVYIRVRNRSSRQVA